MNATTRASQKRTCSGSSMTSTTEPPFYILVSHSSILNNTPTPSTSSATLGHPIIQYQYTDDSPLSLVPQAPDEHVLVLDYDPVNGLSGVPNIKSISRNLAVTGVKVSEAPGATAAHDELRITRNDKMYILETCTTMEDKTNMDASQADLQNAQVALSRFKQRNAILRRALDYPDITKRDVTITQMPSQTVLPPVLPWPQQS